MTKPRSADTPARSVLCRPGGLREAVEARMSPRYSRRGFELLDDARLDEGLMGDLRAHAARHIGEAALDPERADVGESYADLVAIPNAWLAAPPASGQAAADASAAFVVRGCDQPMGALHRHLQPLVEQYVGQRLMPTVCYGPRLYRPGCVLLGHLDRYPTHALGVSVALSGQPWQMQMVDFSLAGDGSGIEITTSPDTHVIYEGGRLLHARMEPLESEYVAAFFHWHPEDHSTGIAPPPQSRIEPYG